MTESDRQQWEGRAMALREELEHMPRHKWNVIKRSDREAELARIEARLGIESQRHAVFIAHRAELAARFYAAPRMSSPR
jgi:hypothetical protein